MNGVLDDIALRTREATQSPEFQRFRAETAEIAEANMLGHLRHLTTEYTPITLAELTNSQLRALTPEQINVAREKRRNLVTIKFLENLTPGQLSEFEAYQPDVPYTEEYYEHMKGWCGQGLYFYKMKKNGRVGWLEWARYSVVDSPLVAKAHAYFLLMNRDKVISAEDLRVKEARAKIEPVEVIKRRNIMARMQDYAALPKAA